MISEMLSSDPEITVVGTARNGHEGVEMALKLEPDLITMDIMMPEMDGFEATKQIMIARPTPIVIVSASTAVHEVATGMRALRAGALTLKLKPRGPGSPEFDASKQELIDTIKAMAEVKVVRHFKRSPDRDVEVPAPKRRREIQETPVPAVTDCHAIGIATSTGGPPALLKLLGKLPKDFPIPILIVQHIADGFVEGFAKWLDGAVGLAVKVGEPGERTRSATVYVAPQDRHMGVTRGSRIQLADDPPIGGFRPSGSYLLESMAETFGDKCVGAILTGMGQDGVSGLRSIRKAGGMTLAQEEQSCVVFGMPGVAVAEGIVDVVVTLEDMAQHFLKLAGQTAPLRLA